MKRKALSGLAALILGAGCAGIAGTPANFLNGTYKDGIYRGAGEGYRGPVAVALYIESGGIADIEILEHREDSLVGGAAMEELRETVLYTNSIDLDVISGATESSAAFLAAVEDALTKALPRQRNRAD